MVMIFKALSSGHGVHIVNAHLDLPFTWGFHYIFFWMLSPRFLNFYLYLKNSCVNLIYVVGSEENTYLFSGFIFFFKKNKNS